MTLSIVGQAKLAPSRWMGYAERMAEGWMLRDLAGEAYVCPRTSWHVRMRLCEAMGKHLDDFRSGSGVSVEVDGTIPHESSEGNAKTSQFVLPRKPHGSGKELRCAGSALAQSCDARRSLVSAGYTTRDVRRGLAGSACGAASFDIVVRGNGARVAVAVDHSSSPRRGREAALPLCVVRKPLGAVGKKAERATVRRNSRLYWESI